MDKNLLLNEFFNQFGYNKEHFLEFTDTYEIANVESLIKEFSGIQDKIYDAIWKLTKPDKKLSEKEIKEFSNKYLKENWNWIDQIGIDAVNRYLLWMCWHEGILK